MMCLILETLRCDTPLEQERRAETPILASSVSTPIFLLNTTIQFSTLSFSTYMPLNITHCLDNLHKLKS